MYPMCLCLLFMPLQSFCRIYSRIIFRIQTNKKKMAFDSINVTKVQRSILEFQYNHVFDSKKKERKREEKKPSHYQLFLFKRLLEIAMNHFKLYRTDIKWSNQIHLEGNGLFTKLNNK